jgi:hypothetical protein
MSESLILIPDISGFTKFVKETEISHSQHIISELIQLIIDANTIDLTVSEVEGDAVLFYSDKIPNAVDLIKQVEKMYIDFHMHLKLYEKYRICTCGACSSASDLSLKFVAHSGEIGFIKFGEKTKPHGHNVIIAHRLLKNSISSGSYFLISESLFKDFKDFEWKSGTESYEDLDLIHYQFKDLQYLLESIPEPTEFKAPDRIENPIKRSIRISDSLDNLAEYIANFSFREKWQKGITRLEYNKDEVNRVGTEHLCIINNNNFHFRTVASEINNGKRVIGERTDNPPFFKEMITYYILEETENGIELSVEIHYFQKSLISRIMTPLIKMQLNKNLWESMISLKGFAEGRIEKN